MHAHFPVIHDATLALMHEFYGVFHGNDMIFTGPVGFIDDGRKRC